MTAAKGSKGQAAKGGKGKGAPPALPKHPTKAAPKRKRNKLPKRPPSIGEAGRRGTSVEMQQRRGYAAELLSLGLPAADVVEHLRQPGPNETRGLGTREAQRAVQAARELLERRAAKGRQRAREEAEGRLEAMLFSATLGHAPIRDRIAIERLLLDLQGLLRTPPPEPVRSTRRQAIIECLDGYSDEDIEQLVDEMNDTGGEQGETP